MRILLIEDDEALARGLVNTLTNDGYSVDHLLDTGDAAYLIGREAYAVLVLDVNLPGQDGFGFLEEIRRDGCKIPVMMLTARDAVRDRVAGLDLGADDYVLKPFETSEFSARVRALARRSMGEADSTLTIGALRLDRTIGVAYVDEHLLNLTRREWSVLETLTARLGKVVTRERLESEVFSFTDEVGPNALEVHVGRLRKKLAPFGAEVMNIRGVGYMLRLPERPGLPGPTLRPRA